MNVWLFKLGEQTPLDEGDPKLSRTAMLAEEFHRAGHDVIWWMATYDHLSKTQRSTKDIVKEVRPGYQIRMLFTTGYRRNVSVQRIIDHWVFDRRLKDEIERLPKPDVIVAAYPTIGACKVLTRYAIANDVPIFIDVRDMWPDIFREYLPAVARRMYPLMFRKQIRGARFVFSNADGIIGITDEFIDWALGYTRRARCESDYVAPLAYNEAPLTPAGLNKGLEYWASQGIAHQDQVICFFGVLSKKIDLRAIASAMPSLSERFPRLKLVLCGNGDELEYVRSLFKGRENVLFPGWVEKAQILTLMHLSKLGLAPYVADRPDFLMSIPTKIIEYFAGSLPVLTSLKGVSLRVITENRCGRYYHDPESFIDAVSGFLDSPAQLDDAGRRARELYEREYRGEVVYRGVREHVERQVAVA